MRRHLFFYLSLLPLGSFGQGIQFLDSTELVASHKVKSMHISERMSGYERQDTSYFCAFDVNGQKVETYSNFYDEMPYREYIAYTSAQRINYYLKTTTTKDTLALIQTSWSDDGQEVTHYAPPKGLTVAQENTVFDAQNNPIKITRYSVEGKIIGKTEYSYSKDAKLTSIVQWNENDHKVYEVYNIYDKSRNLIESKTIEEKVFLQTLRKYDEDNQLIQLTKVDPHQDKLYKTHYTYSNGLCVHIKEVKNRVVAAETTFKYNSKGELIQQRTKWSDDDWATFDYSYFKDGQLRKEVYTSHHGLNTDVQELSYSETGLLLKELKKSNAKKDWEIAYTYFENGFLELAVETHFQNDFERVTRYNYTYFE